MGHSAERDVTPICALLLPRKRGEWSECPHGQVVRAGGECKYGPALGENPHPAATFGERDLPPSRLTPPAEPGADRGGAS